MKKISTLASFVALVMLPMTAALADSSSATASPAVSATRSGSAHAGKAAGHKLTAAKKPYRYLDMVEQKRPSAIRNAVIVYGFGLSEGRRPADKKARCDASDAKSVSECLHGPAT